MRRVAAPEKIQKEMEDVPDAPRQWPPRPVNQRIVPKVAGSTPNEPSAPSCEP